MTRTDGPFIRYANKPIYGEDSRWSPHALLPSPSISAAIPVHGFYEVGDDLCKQER